MKGLVLYLNVSAHLKAIFKSSGRRREDFKKMLIVDF